MMDLQVLLLVLVICSGSCAQSSSTHTECVLPDKPRADVKFLLDGFNHISPEDFSKVKDSLQSLISLLGPVGPDLVRVSLVKNGRDPEADFYLNSFSDQSSVLEAVSQMSQSPALSGGSTRGGLDFIKTDIIKTQRGKRQNVPDVNIFLTDRNSSGVYTRVIDDLLVKTFVIRVKLPGDLQGDYVTTVFNVDDYNRIPDVFPDLTQNFCRWIIEMLTRPRLESLRVTEVQSRRAGVSWEWTHPSRVKNFNIRVCLHQSDSREQMFWVLGQRRRAEISHLRPNTTYTVSVSALYGDGYTATETVDLTTAPDLVRLSGGRGRCSGSVEAMKSQVWSSVCGSDFGLSEAAVVCAELDCGAVSELHQRALFSDAVGQSFHCDRDEASLTACKSSEETRCSSAVTLTCSDEMLKIESCYGVPRLRYKGEWRTVSTVAKPNLDFLSLLCERSGCGPAVSGKQMSYSKLFWWAEPECVNQTSALSDCLDLDLSQNKTNGGLALVCLGLFPAVRASVSSSEGTVSFVSSVSSEVVPEKVLVMLGTNFTVSCSLDDAFPTEHFHLLSPTGNYTLPSVHQSAHFLFQNCSPAHMGNYTCVYCDRFDDTERCIESKTVLISPGVSSGAEQSGPSSPVQDDST